MDLLVVSVAEALHPGGSGDVLHGAAAAAEVWPARRRQRGAVRRPQPPEPGEEE